MLFFTGTGGTTWSFSCPGICFCPLSSTGEPTTVPYTTITTKIHQALDIKGNFTSPVTFNRITIIHYLPDAYSLII